MSKIQEKKLIHESMRQRAFALRLQTGRGWSREELAKDSTWKELDDRLRKLNDKKSKVT